MSTRIPEAIEGIAFNQVPHSENRIHGDEVAQQHGFRGGLVPGVTVSAYACEPAVRAWGMDFLSRGHARVAVKKPLYDGTAFRVVLEDASEARYFARLIDAEGTECAEAEVWLPDAANVAPPPLRRGDGRRPEGATRPPATRESFQRLREQGMWSMPSRFHRDKTEMWRYYREQDAMPELLRYDGAGYANMSFVLGMTNWHLAANVALGPWLHLETDTQLYAPIERDEALVVEGRVVDIFERKGHHFVDVDVAAFRRADSAPVMTSRLRAIYQLRQAGAKT